MDGSIPHMLHAAFAAEDGSPASVACNPEAVIQLRATRARGEDVRAARKRRVVAVGAQLPDAGGGHVCCRDCPTMAPVA